MSPWLPALVVLVLGSCVVGAYRFVRHLLTLRRRKREWATNRIRITGPIEHVGDRWLLRIPLTVGGAQLIASTRGIARVSGETLEIEIPERLVHELNLKDGQRLYVNNDNGEFTFEWDSVAPEATPDPPD